MFHNRNEKRQESIAKLSPTLTLLGRNNSNIQSDLNQLYEKGRIIFMYEHFRQEVILELAKELYDKDISKVTHILDKISMNYDIKEKETALVVREGYPKELKLYLASLKIEGKSDGTIKLYKNRLKIFFDSINKPLNEININDIRFFLCAYKDEHEIKDGTLEKFRQIINVFFDWCSSEDYLDKNPCKNLKKIKYEDDKRNGLTRFQLEKLRRACKTEFEKAIVETLFSTGVRVSELCSMKRSEINDVDKSMVVLGKGKKYNTVYFNDASQIALDEYNNTRNDSTDWLFYCNKTKKGISVDSVEKLFRKLSERCGFYVCPHMMRHTFGSLSLQAGMPIDVVQKAMNHSSVATTQRYAKTLQGDVMNAHRKYVC